ncbi:MAG: galactokinase [Actinomycetota bacterium]|nr:galactokinase [Actinomycetota bacterium]
MPVVFARSPLRVTLAGGGTDLPSWYRRGGGYVVAAAIDRHVFMLVNTEHQDRIRLKHMEWEEADEPGQVGHPILREALLRRWNGAPLELASTSDVPPGTGLGSSGAYAVCALGALALAGGRRVDVGELAEEACDIEIGVLGRTVGKQDQYASAFGGVRAYAIAPDGTVEADRLGLDGGVLASLEAGLMLFYSGEQRSASDLLAVEARGSQAGDVTVERSLARGVAIAHAVREALEAGDLPRFGSLVNDQWDAKLARSPGMATARMNELRGLALDAGAAGVMQMGAGGGGYLLAYAPDPAPVRAAMEAAGAPELRFRLDPDGFRGEAFDPEHRQE